MSTPSRIDRKEFSVSSLGDESDDKAYWLAKTPIERLQALELIRQTVYGYTDAPARLQRIFEVAELPRDQS